MTASDPAPGASSLDERVRETLAAGDTSAAATLVIETLGAELLGYLWAAADSWGDGDELFSTVCERIWRGLPGFRFDCSVRTWAFVIARHRLRTGLDRARRRKPELDLAKVPQLAEIIAIVHSTTQLHLRTDTKARLERLRETLDADDRTLLILRVDQEMAWRDIARVMADGDEDLDRVASRLRKRFERVKQRLREGLLAEHDA
jgi:RNA polymerase sigma-70 factor (ECF subfamily)